ncbi:starch synthase [Salipaludibacillus neizhouensis]|uniref:Glycogen synthase n=1 Tax=Salipaludibacillus neizhouensis TaxID=885475 RepID=A0A3A9K7G2_9BACI|nr:glycogen synthase [Salipaludibacillus neizhouensis]RKL66780.1 starch synthase [Salipaludibacillus neizhouensis]
MTKILFAASECVPFIKTGGLADVIGSLPQALMKDNLADVRVILPLYDEIPLEWQNKMEKKTSFKVEVGWRTHEAILYTLENDGILYYFIKNDFYFSRRGVYGYYDDGERFVFFSQAIIEGLPLLDFDADVLHAHDWQTGLAVAFANIYLPASRLKTVFTIHNIKYQGLLSHDSFDNLFNLSREHFNGLEWNGMLNCMKAAIFHADKITTVSPTYAEEIRQPYYSEGLDSILHEREGDLSGVINGINLEDYHPMKDPYIHVNYKSSRVKKKENKEALQAELGLPVNGDIPMYIAISRLVEQKGFHLLERVLDEFLQEDIQVVILGTGDYEFEHSFSHIAIRNSTKMHMLLQFNEGQARKLYASADFFLMPSKFEPCGLSQLIALQYKTVPIVRETGGLKDTVQAFNAETGEGNGFSFANYNAHELLSILRYSLDVFHDSSLWKKLMKNVNKSSFSWSESAKAYTNIYKSLTTLEDRE